MVPRKQGLIINVSSAAGLFYTYSVVYGICQEAVSNFQIFFFCGVTKSIVRKFFFTEITITYIKKSLMICNDKFNLHYFKPL